MKNKELNYIMYEVLTQYKSGRNRSEVIAAKNETDMWNIYNERHKKRQHLIKDSAIVDSWIQ